MLYLFLLGVADRNGTSYYSDRKIVEKTAVSEVERYRNELIEAGLISYAKPFYQVLSLPEPLCSVPVKRSDAEEVSIEEQERISQMLHDCMEAL